MEKLQKEAEATAKSERVQRIKVGQKSTLALCQQSTNLYVVYMYTVGESAAHTCKEGYAIVDWFAP